MDETGLRDGDQLVVVVMRNGESEGEITIDAISKSEVATAIYTDDENSLIVMHEAITSAIGAIKYHLEKPKIRKLLNQRIAELRDIIAKEEEAFSPSPADDNGG